MNKIISILILIVASLLSIYVISAVALLTMISAITWLSILDNPLIKIIYGLYLSWLGFFSFKISKMKGLSYIFFKIAGREINIFDTLFPVEAAFFIIWGIAEQTGLIMPYTFFSTSIGALILFGSLYIPYYYGNIHGVIFRT